VKQQSFHSDTKRVIVNKTGLFSCMEHCKALTHLVLHWKIDHLRKCKLIIVGIVGSLNFT